MAEQPAEPRTGRAPFRDLNFGFASAESEAARHPDLLLQGFLDRGATADVLTPGGAFLVLGYKGSGKSAIAEHLRLRAESDPLLFVKTTNLSADFHFQAFTELADAAGDRPGGYVVGWQWLLLLHVLHSLAGDEAAMLRPELTAAVDALRDMGLLPARTLRSTVLTSRKRSVTANFPRILNLGLEEVKEVRRGNVGVLVEELLSAVVETRTPSRHLVTVDGLDEIYLRTPAQLDVISALVLAADRLNGEMQRAGVRVKVVVLCRTDLFDRLPGANKNKLRQDSALELDWYETTRDPSRTALVRLAELRARLTDPGMVDLFAAHFPQRVRAGSRTHRTIGHLLAHTRHTPRDFLQLLSRIQRFANGDGPLSADEIHGGLRQYCIEYFVPEIKDELDGPLSREQIDAVFETLGALASREFRLSTLCDLSLEDARRRELDWPPVLKLLFEASAVGNVQSGAGGASYYTFRFRNRHSTLDPNRRMVLHRALVRALNLAHG
jgi:hypothetical protein